MKVRAKYRLWIDTPGLLRRAQEQKTETERVRDSLRWMCLYAALVTIALLVRSCS